MVDTHQCRLIATSTARFAVVLAAAMTIVTAPSMGQVGGYKLQTMNFDMWCQETRHLPPERCDRRLPADEKQFETYRAKVEKFEIPYMKGREHAQQLDRTIMHYDPVDNPITKDPAATSQSPTSSTHKP